MSGERGEVSLIAVLVACTLMIVILASTLSLFESFTARAGDQTRRTEAQDIARTAADRIARNLRNLASPTPEQPEAVDRKEPSDLVFKTVNPNGPAAGTNATNTQRVRYCLGADRRLYQQTQNWTTLLPPPAPTTTACPGTGWPSSVPIATSIVNGAVPVFSYDAADRLAVSQIHVELLVDTDLLRAPPATRLGTGAFLRNQNRKPTAAFTATPTSGGFVLNGSVGPGGTTTSDPEGDPLTYVWYDGAAEVGRGIVFTYRGLTPGTVHQLKLKVHDPAGLTGESPTTTVTA